MSCLYVFGDSLTKGIVFDSFKRRYTVTSRSFAELISKLWGKDIKNYSCMGCTVDKGEDIFRRHLDDITDRDVLFEYGGNDSDHNWKEIAADPEGDHHPRVELNVFYDKYKALLEESLAKGLSPKLITLPPIDAVKYFNWISRDMDDEEKDNILRWLGGSVEYIYKWHEMYNIKILELAREMNIPVIDIRTGFLMHKNYSVYLCEDGIHPNEQGHELIYEIIKGSENA